MQIKNKFNIEILTPNSDPNRIINCNNYIWHLNKKLLPKDHLLQYNTKFNIIKSRCIGIYGTLFGIILRIN